MDQNSEWKPISFLPMLRSIMDGMVKENTEFIKTLSEAESKPHVLDDSSFKRLLKVYNQQNEDLGLYEEQIARWKQLILPKETHDELNRMERQVGINRVLVNNILTMGEELKKGTIDTILAKDDLDLAFEILEGKRTSPADIPPELKIPKAPPGKPPVYFSAEQHQIASMIDQKVKQILKADGDVVEILTELHPYMPGFKIIMNSLTPEDLNELGRQYYGFYHFAQVLEDLAEGIQSGKIKVPKD